ncbi:uncharacterized protein C8Q71DRAFT_782995 [Rhodofomes roseus]|uniref:Uncharacterized protein n=1 Tax=Rhodofomes roseus TaxID=34475 RepID=A0A4Y9Z5U7_9APHY|nr:uncharacterized protein C8Q71DRAFT_782995 [Rhodofomes roseus]KAH9831157.1 hypothetical protein C8Q71DRAFT_782995 [Rhodofomes roseus]TFY69844.1 hypothetical protein EVJ58_g190 [Rhodofomes roseus]
MFRLPTLVSLFALAAAKLAQATPCVSFDANFNLLVFGLDGKDWNAGTQDSWSSGSATDITTSGRPSFDAPNTTCYLSQYYNAVYVMNGDSSDKSAVYIYDAAKKSWSTQSVTTGKFDPSNFVAVLDHDTNVFYAISGTDLYFLNMGSETTANSSALSWVDVETDPFPSSYTAPVAALAQNHIHFLDVPNVPAGEAKIFVIHFSYFQPDAQSYPASSGNSFPAAHGKTASFFQSEGVQQEFAFIPDDGSATYVINVENNSTTSYAGPTSKDAGSVYAASISALVQLDSSGNLYFFPYTEGDASANTAAAWTKVQAVSKVAPASSAAASATGGHSGSGSATGSAGSSSSTGTSGNTSGAPAAVKVSRGLAAAGVLGIVGYLL